jgi:4-amino-4-deoxy-L-arabinose transferase-like glycosyltransferase
MASSVCAKEIMTLRSRNLCFVLFFLSLIFFLLFNHRLLVTDPVESNYALTAKEMVISSDWLSPQIYGKAWFDKPIFFYWLMALSFKMLGFSDLAARLVPALFGATGVALIFWFTDKTVNRSTAILAALIMGTSLEYVLLSKLIITDMVLFVFNAAALVFFYTGYSREDHKKQWYWGMYASLAFAVLTKGPVGLLLPGLVMFVFLGIRRNWAELNRMAIPAGLLIFAVIALPWYGAMYYVHGTEFTNIFFGVHNYLRATVSEHPKDNVVYYYLIVFLLMMLPWSPVALKALVVNVKEKSAQKTPLNLFCLIWAAIYLIFYSLMATKYITYTFPILFPVAIVTAHYIQQLLEQGNKKAICYWFGIPLLLTSIGYLFISYHYFSSLIFTVSCLLLITVWMLWGIKEKSAKIVFQRFSVAQIAIYILLSIVIFPAITHDRSESELARIMVEGGGRNVGFYEFYSTSAVYYSGISAIRIVPSDAFTSSDSSSLDWSSKYTMPRQSLGDFVAQAGDAGALLVVPDEKREEFLDKNKLLQPQLLKRLPGFSYYRLSYSL